MIPAQFDYVAPATLEEALLQLTRNPDEAKLLAGGHSLIPAMKLRLAQPQMLIDIGRIKDLAYIREEDGQILIGAMTTHQQIESSDLLKKVCPLLPECASHIGDVQVRNKGTIGGSLAHADPAADWPAAIIALGARMAAISVKGERFIKADDFFTNMFSTALTPGEILREIRIGIAKTATGYAYAKMHHPASGFAVVGVAVSLTRNAQGACESASIGVTGVAANAYRPVAAQEALLGTNLDESSISAAAARVCEGIEANSDLFASEDYRRHLAEVYARRAITAAASRVK
jgi:carbon-monoxide dehydrogenase medium subunit